MRALNRILRWVSLLAAATLSAGCAWNGGELPGASATTVHYVRDSAEYRALATQTYRLAGDALRARVQEGRPPAFAVVLDADETLLDNSEFEQKLVVSGRAFNEAAWDAWVRLEQAAPIAGARPFLALVKASGGYVVVVTNRRESVCEHTKRNLEKLYADARGLPLVDRVLCAPSDGKGGYDRTKGSRFDAVLAGKVVPTGNVLMWVGDQITDFPAMPRCDSGPRDAMSDERIGRQYFILPNPMYGGWMNCTPLSR